MRSAAATTVRLCKRGGRSNHRQAHGSYTTNNNNNNSSNSLSTITTSPPFKTHHDNDNNSSSVDFKGRLGFISVASQQIASATPSSELATTTTTTTTTRVSSPTVSLLLSQQSQVHSSYHQQPTTTNNNNNNMINRYYSTTQLQERPALVLGFGAVALTAKAGQHALRAYQEWKESQPPPPTEEELKANTTSNQESSNNTDTNKTHAKDTNENTQQNTDSTSTNKRKNFFSEYFNMDVNSKYYEGGFEEKMTKREAALILGVRESSTEKRIKEAHRKLLILNHPDTGGSTFIAGKLNEAKELLLKGRAR